MYYKFRKHRMERRAFAVGVMMNTFYIKYMPQMSVFFFMCDSIGINIDSVTRTILPRRTVSRP